MVQQYFIHAPMLFLLETDKLYIWLFRNTAFYKNRITMEAMHNGHIDIHLMQL